MSNLDLDHNCKFQGYHRISTPVTPSGDSYHNPANLLHHGGTETHRTSDSGNPIGVMLRHFSAEDEALSGRPSPLPKSWA